MSESSTPATTSAPATPAESGTATPITKSAGPCHVPRVLDRTVEQRLTDGPEKKLAKKKENEARLALKAAKAAKAAATAPAGEKKAKKEKEKEEEAPFVNTTPKGEKKGMCVCWNHLRSFR